jgi:ABC-type lipoprotein release transport system permease subunit
MKLFKTAIRSLIGNGLKTWLNVFVLSISFVLIIIMQGILQGWSKQAIDDSVRWELAGGQYWQQNYDPYDPFSLDSSTVEIPSSLKKEYDNHLIEPVLITQASIYHNGRMQGVFLKGIRPDQQILQMPTQSLRSSGTEIPVMIGAFMARQNKLKMNDVITLRWRDKNGTFEAADIRIAGIFKTTVPSIDNGTVWISLDRLQEMTLHANAANILIKSPEMIGKDLSGWVFNSVEQLTASVVLMVKTKSMGTSVMYFIFLLLAMLAIFDTQTLAIFRRQREIGTLVAMGMTQKQVVWHFTLEGSLYALLAIIVGAIWGFPLFYWFSVHGISFGMDAADFGIPMADTMYTVISPKLVAGTILFIFFVTAFVSYLPARKIAKMKPTDAIRGKIV